MQDSVGTDKELVLKARARIESWTQLLRFLAVGGINTIFGYSLYAVLVWLMLPPQIALLLSTILGVLFNFATYGRVAFDRRLGWASFFRFVAVYAVLYGINVVLLRVLLNMGQSPYIAQLILLIPMTGGAFLAQRYFVFRSRVSARPENLIRS